MVIIGEKEIQSSKDSDNLKDIVVSVRTREANDLGQINLYELVTKLKTQIEKYA